jgi:transketolase
MMRPNADLKEPKHTITNKYDHYANKIRKIILQQSMRAHVGHIGSALSIADIISALYFGALKSCNPLDPNRDRFILSKGHAALRACLKSHFMRG